MIAVMTQPPAVGLVEDAVIRGLLRGCHQSVDVTEKGSDVKSAESTPDPSRQSQLSAGAGGRGDLAFGADAGLHDVMSTMRAMRRLKPDPVPREMLELLVRAATWAPSGSNEQAYSWVVVTDRDQMRRVAEVWRRAYGIYQR